MSLDGALRGRKRLFGFVLVLALVASVVVASSSGAGARQLDQVASGSEVSVSNLGETGTTHWCSARSDWYCAQGFTTGAASDGYVLGSVTASFVDKAGSPGDVVATLHASVAGTGTDGKRPDADNGASLATLSGDNPDTAGDYTFTCSGSGCALAADTTYFVRFSATGGSYNDNEYRWKTVLNGFGETAVPSDNGWILADELDYRPDNTSWTAAGDLAAYLKVDATVVQQSEPPPEPAVTAERDDDGDAADISWTAYTGDDFSYYRVIVCDDSQYKGSYCDGTVFVSDAFFDAGYTGPVSVNGLAGDTGYGVILQVWRGSVLKVHAKIPPLPTLEASEPTSNTMTLTLRNYSAQWYYTRQADGGAVSECSSQVPLEYVYVHGLSANTTYTFTAYRDDKCEIPVGAQTTGTTTSPPGSAGVSAESANSAPPAVAKVYIYRHCDQMLIGWHHIDGATGHNINYSTKGKWWSWHRIKTNVMHNWWYAANFNADKSWWFAVQTLGGPRGTDGSMDGKIEGGWRDSAHAPPPPCQPTDLQGVWTDQGIELSWTHGKRTTGYDLNYSSDGGATWASIATNVTGNNTGVVYQWAGADTSNTYVFAVRPDNNGVKGGWTNSPVIPPPPLTLTPNDISATTASLALTGHHVGDWSVKRTAPTLGTCVFVETASAYEHHLSSLMANTQYTYAAYRDKQCMAEAASATFTTPYSLTATSVTSTSATLTLAGHSGNWWYEANAAPDNSCKGPVSGTTKALSGLTNNTAYTYTAYSDSTCSTALASAVVSTYLTVGNLDKPIFAESCRVSRNTHCAVGFTTGGNTGGYTLAAITARFKSKTHPPGKKVGDIVVTLHESATNSVGDGKRPADAERATLSGSNPDAAGDYTYACTAGANNDCSLAANTTYFVEFAATEGSGTLEGYNWATTESDDENLNPTGNGWSLANGTDFHVDGREWLAEYADTGLLLVSATAD